ncbi:MAG: PucR family transcriptional regulator [Bacillota bacterium]
MPLTVREALALPALAGSEVLAGSAGLEREVTSVTVIDAPDGIRFIRGGEFILSTLFLYKEGEPEQVRLLAELKERGAAALGVKLRFVETLSGQVKALADDWHIPLVCVPDHLAWKDIINAVLEELLGRQARELQQSWAIHRSFIDLALEGRGLAELARALADLVRNPVLIVESCNGSVFVAGGAEAMGGSDRPAGSSWAGTGATPGSTHLEGDVLGPWLAAEGEHMHPVVGYAGIWRVTSPGGDSRVVGAIRTGRQQGGWIVVWERDGTLDGWGFTAMQHAATVAALEVEKLRALRNLERSMRDDFLHHLVRGDFESEATARERAWKLGWELGDVYVPVAIRLVGTPVGWLDEKGTRAAWRVVDLLQGYGLPPRTMAGVDHAERPLVLFPVALDSPGRADDVVAREMRRLIGLVSRRYPRLELLAGIGRPGRGLQGLSVSYREAVTALELAPSLARAGPVVQFRDLGVHRLVRDASGSEVAEFVRDILGPLIDHDRKHRTELVRTLRAFLEHGGNYREAARALYLHHSTVRYRLEQVERLCGIKLNSARDRFNLQLALAFLLANNLSI